MMASQRTLPQSPGTGRVVAVVGAESAGKSTLVAGLTGRPVRAENIAGATVAVERATADGWTWLDTPGIRARGDTETTRRTLAVLDAIDVVALVVSVASLDTDLDELVGVVAGRRGVLIVTFWDKVDRHDRLAELARHGLLRVGGAIGVPVVTLDGRAPGKDAAVLRAALGAPGTFIRPAVRPRVGLQITPRRTVLERRGIGSLIAAALTLMPVGIAVTAANLLAGLIDPVVRAATGPPAARFASWDGLAGAVLAGDYGLLTMGPLLLVWALPTVVLVALLLGAAKASGLADRVGAALDPLARHFGLHGHDVTRVLMGFGCNVPAVVGTRSCSSCTRDTAIASIAWGAACSYQLPASAAVFAAADRWWLVWPYLLVLGVSTLAHARLVSGRQRRQATLLVIAQRRAFLVRPSWRHIQREVRVTLSEFQRKALPIFVGVSAVAATIDHLGALTALADVLGPALSAVRLPVEAATPLALAAIRKDGVLLLERVAPMLTSGQLLTAVFLAGTLLPCLVTAATIARERGAAVAGPLIARQATTALLVGLALAWGSALMAA